MQAGAVKRIAGCRLAALVLASLSFTALAAAPFAHALGNKLSVRVSPTKVKINVSFKVTAEGSAAAHDTLWLYLDFQRCASTRAGESARKVPADSEHVYGVFKIGPMTASSEKVAADHVCSYLLSPSGKQLARASATFMVTR